MRQMLFVRRVLEYINLESEMDDHERIHNTIEKDVNFRGTNLWILSFAIIVASVGLNMNSTAVIIGAMLISPLMGPINGMGYSIATYNFPLFRKAAKNLAFAALAGLLASTAYFALSPISTAHSELLARTSPTIYDVLIALFGGLAGIVAISSKQKGNVIPGVAIATALMPPLCTSGYGLATGQFEFFFGAFYLFTINTVFIAISSVIISQILRFPIRTIIDAQQKKRVNQWISIVITIVLIPSIYFGYALVQKERFNENAARYVKNISIIEGNFLLKNDIDPERRTISLIYGGPTLSGEQQRKIRDKANDFSLKDATITFQQGLAFDDLNSGHELEDLKDEVNRLQLQIVFQENIIDSMVAQKAIGSRLLGELQTLYPNLATFSAAYPDQYFDPGLRGKPITVILMSFKGNIPDEEDQTRIREWLKARLAVKNLRIYFEKE